MKLACEAPRDVCLKRCSGSVQLSSLAVTNRENAFLTETDGTAVPAWIFSIAMVACMVVLHAEANTVNDHWKASFHVSGLVTWIPEVH